MINKMEKQYDIRDPLGSCRRLIKVLLESLLQAEFRLFLSRERAAGRSVQRNGFAQKTLRGCFGKFTIRVPRDRGGRFSPVVLPKGKILIHELEDLLVPVFGSFTGRRHFDGRLRAFIRVVATLYGESFSHDERRDFLSALVRGCREHRAWISGLRYEPAELGVVYKEYGWLGPGYGLVSGYAEAKGNLLISPQLIASENLTNSLRGGCDSGMSAIGLLDGARQKSSDGQLADADDAEPAIGFPEWTGRKSGERRIAGVFGGRPERFRNEIPGSGVSGRLISRNFSFIFIVSSPLAALAA